MAMKTSPVNPQQYRSSDLTLKCISLSSIMIGFLLMRCCARFYIYVPRGKVNLKNNNKLLLYCGGQVFVET